MRHKTRRNGRVRRIRLTRRYRQKRTYHAQTGGDPSRCSDLCGNVAIPRTENIANWLKEVFNLYSTIPRIEMKMKEDGRPYYTDMPLKISEVVFRKPGEGEEKDFILPMYIFCNEHNVLQAEMPDDKDLEQLYKLDGNYGAIIKSHVEALSRSPTYRGFSAAVESYNPEEAQVGIVHALLETENMLRMMMRSKISDSEIHTYEHISRNVRNLSDVTSYPLYVWAVAEAVKKDVELQPVLVSQQEMAKEENVEEEYTGMAPGPPMRVASAPRGELMGAGPAPLGGPVI